MDKLKFWVGMAGAAVVAVLEVVGPEGDVGKILSIVAAVATAVGIYAAPNLEAAGTLRNKAVKAQEAGRL